MLRAVLTRRNRVIKLIQSTRSLPAPKQTNELMCLCYILAFGAIEFMIESIIRGWIQHNIRKHKYSYPEKTKVDSIISILSELSELNLGKNNGINYENVCELVQKLTGSPNQTLFKQKIAGYPGGLLKLNEAIKRIKLTRHNIAHGTLWPTEASPNISELELDFNHIYNCLIINLNSVLPHR